jgi:uridine monophosphate synthetase
MFFAKLRQASQSNRSFLCVGLDPHPSLLPEKDVAAFNRAIIEATADLVCCYKPNLAFYESMGPQGLEVLLRTVEAIPRHVPVIADGKRGDIASTADAYARSAFHALGAHAVTLSPYLGRDSVEPFLADPEKGAFLLCKTSNPGAGDLQDLEVGGTGELREPLYLAVARLAQSWNTRNNVGLVVGATQPEAMARVRAVAPGLWFLAPGVGAQGGELESALQAGLRADGKGLLLPVSRAISRASDPGQAAAKLRDEIVTIAHRPRPGK